ncbi:MAG: hypothetical protein EKK41_01670 [Hyphomicrobiales bacterium]|jgi:surface antigen|nr:MAG: hypothetical protein EKK41_01670 [Hyphomicrobiales bacterium]
MRTLRIVGAAVIAAGLTAFFPTAISAQGPRPIDASPGASTPGPQFGIIPGTTARAPFKLDEADEIATLEAIRYALTEVGDGGSYVWYREHGRLNGLVNPTSSFKDAKGRVCRHIVLIMSAGVQSNRIEGVACRDGDGRWLLEG